MTAAHGNDQFQLGQTDKIPHMVGALGGALAGQLVVFAQERRQFQGLEVMGQQHLRRIGHDAPPPRQAHITGGGRGRHRWPEAGQGIDIQVRVIEIEASLDTAQHKVFDGVVADRTQALFIVSFTATVKHLRRSKVSTSRKDLDVFPLAGLAHARLQETAQGWDPHHFRAVPIRLAARPDPGQAHLVLQQSQVVDRIEHHIFPVVRNGGDRAMIPAPQPITTSWT